MTSLISNNLSLSNISVTWIDDAGKAYTSQKALQDASVFFKIVSVENYDTNENNQSTKKYIFNLSVMFLMVQQLYL